MLRIIAARQSVAPVQRMVSSAGREQRLVSRGKLLLPHVAPVAALQTTRRTARPLLKSVKRADRVAGLLRQLGDRNLVELFMPQQ
jgi:hypothetical protein